MPLLLQERRDVVDRQIVKLAGDLAGRRNSNPEKLIAGTVLSWARALGEFGATITFAGNFPGRTQTMPLAVYVALETNPDSAIALSLVLVLVSLVVLVSVRRLPAAKL